MIATTELLLTDLSGEKRLRASLARELSPRHTVEQAVEHFLTEMDIPRGNSRWGAYARGVKLDTKRPLADLPEEDAELWVVPEVSAGGTR